MTVKPTNTDAIEQGTGLAWSDWLLALDAAGAKDMKHNQIVKAARATKDISGWWAQGVAVAYEQHIGRRLPGQMSDGTFSASVSRTVRGQREAVFQEWCAFAAELAEINGVALANAPTTSRRPKWLYWRAKYVDGSGVSISFEAKGAAKVRIAVEHRKLSKHGQIAEIKNAWADALGRCFEG